MATGRKTPTQIQNPNGRFRSGRKRLGKNISRVVRLHGLNKAMLNRHLGLFKFLDKGYWDESRRLQASPDPARRNGPLAPSYGTSADFEDRPCSQLDLLPTRLNEIP